MERGREKEGAVERICLAHNIYLPRNKSRERLFPFPLVFVALGFDFDRQNATKAVYVAYKTGSHAVGCF